MAASVAGEVDTAQEVATDLAIKAADAEAEAHQKLRAQQAAEQKADRLEQSEAIDTIDDDQDYMTGDKSDVPAGSLPMLQSKIDAGKLFLVLRETATKWAPYKITEIKMSKPDGDTSDDLVIVTGMGAFRGNMKTDGPRNLTFNYERAAVVKKLCKVVEVEGDFLKVMTVEGAKSHEVKVMFPDKEKQKIPGWKNLTRNLKDAMETADGQFEIPASLHVKVTFASWQDPEAGNNCKKKMIFDMCHVD